VYGLTILGKVLSKNWLKSFRVSLRQKIDYSPVGLLSSNTKDPNLAIESWSVFLAIIPDKTARVCDATLVYLNRLIKYY
jgi:hypothetical protein